MSTNDIRKVPVGESDNPIAGFDGDLQWMLRANSAFALIAVGHAIDLESYLSSGDKLNRQLYVAETEGRIVIGSILEKIEGADLAMQAGAERPIFRDLGIGARWRARR